jgi:hypothetical protein
MSTLLLVFYSVTWALIGFAVIRAIVIAWGYHRRLATATAFAVAAAFVLGSFSPFSLRQRGGPPPPPVAAVPVRVPIACPPSAKQTAAPGSGHIDTFVIGGANADMTHPIDLHPNETFHVGGWVLSAAGLATGLCVLVDGRPVPFVGTYGVDRPDVAAVVGKPEDRGAGFDVALHLPAGTHVVTLGPVQPDGTVTLVAQRITLHVR